MLRALLIAAIALPAWAEPFAGPVRVIDGDTIDVGETRVRLHGVDAAEGDQTCETGGAVWPCGRWVTGRVRDLFEGSEALCEPVDVDRYGRIVARCSVEALGRIKEEGLRIDMGAEIVGRGLAIAYVKYSDDYAAVEAVARAKGAGVFAGTMATPAEHRAGAGGAAPPDPGCPIKGNISDGGRIFHPPGGAFYDRTSIDEADGERWFCTPEEAAAAGWRPSRR